MRALSKNAEGTWKPLMFHLTLRHLELMQHPRTAFYTIAEAKCFFKHMLKRGVLRVEVNWSLAYPKPKTMLDTHAPPALMITTIEVNKMVAMLHVDVYLQQVQRAGTFLNLSGSYTASGQTNRGDSSKATPPQWSPKPR